MSETNYELPILSKLDATSAGGKTLRKHLKERRKLSCVRDQIDGDGFRLRFWSKRQRTDRETHRDSEKKPHVLWLPIVVNLNRFRGFRSQHTSDGANEERQRVFEVRQPFDPE